MVGVPVMLVGWRVTQPVASAFVCRGTCLLIEVVCVDWEGRGGSAVFWVRVEWRFGASPWQHSAHMACTPLFAPAGITCGRSHKHEGRALSS